MIEPNIHVMELPAEGDLRPIAEFLLENVDEGSMIIAYNDGHVVGFQLFSKEWSSVDELEKFVAGADSLITLFV